MIPKTLSASSASAFELCPSRYRTEFIEKTPGLGNNAGSLGTACHATLEFWVKEGHYLKPWPTVGDRHKAIKAVWTAMCGEYMADMSRYNEGWELVKNWVDRTTWMDRQVVSCEVKEHFDLPTSRGVLPITYIWDRCDLINNSTEVEVVDYKTVIQPVSSQDLKSRIQPRVYALAAAIKFKEMTKIWVTYDLLRYTPVSVAFTREDNLTTWKYLKSLAERIYQSEGLEETLNPECRFCLRKTGCQTLLHHFSNCGILKAGDSLPGAIDQRAEMKYAADGLRAAIEEIDELILSMMEEKELFQFETDKTEMKVTAARRRTVDSERVAPILGEKIMARFGKIGIGELDQILADAPPDIVQAVKPFINNNFGSPKVSTKPKKNLTAQE